MGGKKGVMARLGLTSRGMREPSDGAAGSRPANH